ncbi:acetate--CoA ligase [Oligoflexus tunisiensis]|uniref:acetate--CoA ligase n=1 Tax=Oligoflexus tunisiensis TaxID=708132 RepID=UPI000AE0F886|nr:acetate--CoA ligase [Oligoflexus tunisiensis]
METIVKPSHDREQANLKDYEKVYASYGWLQAEACMTGLPGHHGLNMAYEAVDRHVQVFHQGDKVALRWCPQTGPVIDMTWQELMEQTARFANGLTALGLQQGDAVFALCPRQPEFYVAVLGSLKHRCLFSPLFVGFGPGPLHARMQSGHARVLVTTRALYQTKVKAIRTELPDLHYVVLIDADPGSVLDKGCISYREWMDASSPHYAIGPTSAEDAALIHFTSGTTGRPKGSLHVHEAIIAHHVSAQFALDLRAGDVFWCTADPGWATGIFYGILAPLSNGATVLVDGGEGDAERWYQLLETQKVNVWYTEPAAIRRLMQSGEEASQRYRYEDLRLIASGGEPLTAEAVRWGEKVFRKPIHDTWWQTETGSIMIANFRSTDIRPGSMGRPLPGIHAGVLKRQEGRLVPAAVDEEGELALRTPWPSLFRACIGREDSYRKSFVDGWYLTGDLVRRDADGYFWFEGRVDDVIKSSGHWIGPFEVESVLMEHPAVAEAAVIGKPDPMHYEVGHAFVTLKPNHMTHEDLRLEILDFARERLGPALAPRDLVIQSELPHTRSGKLMRRLLKAQVLGEPVGDMSPQGLGEVFV